MMPIDFSERLNDNSTVLVLGLCVTRPWLLDFGLKCVCKPHFSFAKWACKWALFWASGSRHLNNLSHCAFCRHMQTCKNLIGCIPTRMGGLGSLGIFIACYIGLLLTYNTAQKFYITSYIVYVMTDWNIAVVYETMLHHILYSMFPRYKHNTWMIFWFQDTLLPHSCHLLIKIFRGTLRQLFSPWLLCWRTFFWLKIFLETHSAHQSSCE